MCLCKIFNVFQCNCVIFLLSFFTVITFLSFMFLVWFNYQRFVMQILFGIKVSCGLLNISRCGHLRMFELNIKQDGNSVHHIIAWQS